MHNNFGLSKIVDCNNSTLKTYLKWTQRQSQEIKEQAAAFVNVKNKSYYFVI
jgi:hypothetical protein